MPKGSSMLPRLAARVWSTTTGRTLSPWPASPSTSMVNGTNVIRATSLVISIDEKNGRATRIAHPQTGDHRHEAEQDAEGTYVDISDVIG